MPREKKTQHPVPQKPSTSTKGGFRIHSTSHHLPHSHVCCIETILKYYLFAYNIVAALGWVYIFCRLSVHLLKACPPPVQASTGTKASSTLTHYLSSIPFLKSSTLLAPSTPAQIESRLPEYLVPYFKRASTAYDKVGEQTAWVQTLALLEIVHVLLGFVRSSIETTVMQVFSRLFLVWWIVERYETVSP